MYIITKKVVSYKDLLSYVDEKRKLGYGVTVKLIQGGYLVTVIYDK